MEKNVEEKKKPRPSPFVNISLSYEGMGKRAAQEIATLLRDKPDAVIGLATGNTPKSMYRELIRMHNDPDIKLDFSKATFFNLDEYVGLPHDHLQSYHHYMNEQLFDYINVDRGKIHIPDGTAKNIDEECRRYEKAIRDAGGIDLQVLGIGPNGHIGFSEPGTPFDRETHKTVLTQETREANAPNFGSIDLVPHEAITMGPKTIMDAKKIILLANGEGKMEPVYKALKGEVTEEVPASILQLHKDVTFYLDRKAAKDFDKYFSAHAPEISRSAAR